MKICYLAPVDSIHTQRRARYFRNRGHEIDIITFSKGNDDNIDIHHLEPKSRTLGGKVYFFSTKLWTVRKLIREINPDILNAHYLTSYGLFGAASGFHPLFVTAIGSDILSDCKKSSLFHKINQLVLQKADYITAGSDYMIQKIAAMGTDSRKVIKVPFGVDLEMFNPEVRNLFKSHEMLSLLSTRGFNEEHNVGLLVRALPHVLKRFAQLDVIIIGGGSQEKKLKTLAEQLKIADRVKFPGVVSHEDIPYYLGRATIYVSTSSSDSEHVSLQEAMACGTFPVVTDIPVNRDWIVDGKNGFLVPTDNPEFLARRIIESIDRSELRRYGQEYNWKLVQTRLSFKNDLRKLENIYYEFSGRK